MSETKRLNLTQAVATLERFVAQAQPSDELGRAGVIQAFEFCFELTWKYFKDIAASQGTIAGSPKQAMKAAFQMGLINDDNLWVDMLADCNRTVHTYNQDLAIEIFQRIVARYVGEFRRVCQAANFTE